MIATQKLAQKLQGTTQTAAQKINTTLSQGSGFLSPQTCTTNPNFNKKMLNEFQQPTFDMTAFNTANPPPDCTPNNQVIITVGLGKTGTEADENARQACLSQWSAYNASFSNKLSAAQADFNQNSTCPKKPDGSSGFAATTPGAVAANQIMSSMSSTFRQSELGAALGNSIGAILNSLLSHFLDQGLSALGNTINGTPAVDTWTYQGQSLGSNISGTTGTSGTTSANAGFSASPSTVSEGVGETATVNISGGLLPYTISTQPDALVAEIISPTATISVIGIGPGSTSAVFTDSSKPVKTITIPIIIGAASSGTSSATDPVGDCNNYTTSSNATPQSSSGISKSMCTTLGGTWSPTAATDNTPGDCNLSGGGVEHNVAKSTCTTIGGNWSPTAAVSNGPLGICSASGFTSTTPMTEADCSNQSSGAGKWDPLGTCTQVDGTTTTTTQTACGANIHNGIIWIPNK
jgi:hypothetical protein